MEEKIVGMLVEKFGGGVGSDTQLNDLAEDSLSKVELLFEIEKISGLKLPTEYLLDAETVGDILKLIGSKSQKIEKDGRIPNAGL